MNFRETLHLWIIVLCLALSAKDSLAQFEKKPWPQGIPIPSIQLTDLSGKAWDLKQLKGKVVILNFWATWCAPCLEELPSIQALQDFNSSNEAIVLTVNFKELPSKVRHFVNQNGYSFPVVADQQGDISKKWGVRLFPTTVVISPQGKPTWIVEGPVDWANKEISDWLKTN